MCKKIVLLVFVSALLLLATLSTRIMTPVSALTIDVSPGESIQDAINLAGSEDTIFVHAGTYHERVVVNKTVSLIGENPATTIIDGNGTGIVVRVKASNVTIRGFTIQNGGNTSIQGGIYVTNHTAKISNNVIRNNAYGIELLKSNGSIINDNIIMNNSWYGIYIHESNENTIYDNTIANNSLGAYIPSMDIINTFYHNNFLDNKNQVSDISSSKWSNDTEGNYWSDYTGVDTDGDGIGNTKTPHLEIDRYPLIIPTRPFPVVWDGTIYLVAVFSNSTVSGFYFSYPSKEIGFNVTGLSSKTGFCNVTIPKQLLRDNPWKVYDKDENELLFTSRENATHTSLYLTYNHSIQMIRIIGTEVIPELPVAILLPLLIILTLVPVILKKRKERTFKL